MCRAFLIEWALGSGSVAEDSQSDAGDTDVASGDRWISFESGEMQAAVSMRDIALLLCRLESLQHIRKQPAPQLVLHMFGMQCEASRSCDLRALVIQGLAVPELSAIR